MSKADAIDISIERITPAKAAQMLEGNENNRSCRESRIATYARDMKNGDWGLTGDAIKFNGKKLLDGQHRLLACVASDTAFTTVVARNVSENVHAMMDTGKSRSIADELRWRGEADYARLGAVLNLIWQYEHLSTGARVASRTDLLKVLADNPTVRESIPATRSTETKAPGLPRTQLATVHFLVAREHGSDMADAFVAAVLKGTDYVEGDPCLLLRNYAASVLANRMFRPGGMEWFAIMLKAANFWLTGRTIRTLRWRRVGPQRETFPRLISAQDL